MKPIGIVCQNLRHQVFHVIVFRQDIPQLFFAQRMLLIRHDKRSKIAIRSREILFQCVSVNVSGNTLKRGNIKFHFLSPVFPFV